MKNLFVVAAVALFSVQGFALSQSEILEDRLERASCWSAKNQLSSEIRNTQVKQVKQVESGSRKTTIQLALIKDGSLVFVPTEGKNRCSVNRFSLVRSNFGGQISIDDLTVMGNKVFMIGDDKRPYFMYTDGQIYELLTSGGNHYSTVKAIKGSSNGKSITLKLQGNPDVTIDEDKLSDRKKRKVELASNQISILSILIDLLLD